VNIPSELLGHFVNRELAHIEGYAPTIGVFVQATFDDAEVIHISTISRYNRADSATKGNGGKIIRLILDVADAIGVPVDIEHMTDETALGAYYASFGFVPEAAPNLITNMRRMPVMAKAA
jgi:hypothetical protein